MDHTNLQAQVDLMLNNGMDKLAVFRVLTEQKGVSPRKAAWCIAVHADVFLIDRYGELIDYLVWIVLLQALAGAWLGYQLSHTPLMRMCMPLLAASVPLLFAWGFFRNYAQAYNLYLLVAICGVLPYGLLLMQFPSMFGFALLSIHILASGYVWFVRRKIFPDIGWWGPRLFRHNKGTLIGQVG
ncbi:hypothetical protein KIK84_07940 [Curvibacter sp. CHRR-16]|uniref:hypothetical protein n=1 Tax=Curvibacter sp. CHRR-16 TaxID=2835872 RepID=UPI001BD9E607|nr:hypothetical protein [Curvibacter sp. CHRR-16]MBT0570253.1 hypothetical protein [Curvibacter sp. CHRR-16]